MLFGMASLQDRCLESRLIMTSISDESSVVLRPGIVGRSLTSVDLPVARERLAFQRERRRDLGALVNMRRRNELLVADFDRRPQGTMSSEEQACLWRPDLLWANVLSCSAGGHSGGRGTLRVCSRGDAAEASTWY
jgi:hypothetical protein